MSLIKVDYGDIGEDASIVPDTSQQIGSITTAGGTFTATENCIMQGSIQSTSGSQTLSVTIAKDGDSITALSAGLYQNFSASINSFFVPKGYTVTVSSISGASYDLKFYKIA